MILAQVVFIVGFFVLIAYITYLECKYLSWSEHEEETAEEEGEEDE